MFGGGKIATVLYSVNGHDVPLFSIGKISGTLGFSNEAIRKKEERGVIPPARFKSAANTRLYTVEEIALFEYIFKEIWTKSAPFKTPDWVRGLCHDSMKLAQSEVVKKGRVESPDAFKVISDKYKGKFNRYRAYTYVQYWRSVLLDETEEDYSDEIDWDNL
jgi:hypothetical protein